ncbi:MAG: hypothetical protein OXE52_01145 [Chloroflexi bacterium]|nr:hypothetical protein [Chloroflexota bacterium]
MRYIILVLIFLISAVATWAHDDEPHDENEAEATDFSAVAVPENPSYHEHVRPILEASCLACHADGQIAAYAPFTSQDDVIFFADDIAFHVSARLMPPWMPSALNIPLKHDRSLSDEEIATIIAWAEGGAQSGDEESYQPPAATYAFPELRADLTLQLEQAYVPDEDAQDDYRCFAFPLEIGSPSFITAYEFIPDVPEMAHHGIVYLLDEALAPEIAARDYEDGRPGWSCYGSAGLSKGGDIIATWTPGTFGVRYPAGTGYRIKPGESIVVQLHYNLGTTRAPDRTRVHLELESDDSGLEELMTLPLSAPVEIPCPSDIEGPQCQRENAIKRIAELYGEKLSNLPDKRLKDCRQTLADYAENTGEHAVTYCDFPSPFPFTLTLYGVLGHMHELGRSFRMELNPEGDNPIMLLDIPRWDFHWQDRYQFVEPVQVNFGSVLRMTCAWDNRLSDDPRYVVWGEGTADEMCFGTVMIKKP